jgi:hypothetical protein
LQLELGALPVAHPRSAADEREAWLRRLLDAARAAESSNAFGPWWTGATLANRMRLDTAQVGPALRCLVRRGVLHRDQLGRGPHGEVIYVYTVAIHA